MTTLPDWMRPPRPEGWLADDLDDLHEAPRHTELIDGTLVFMMSPQRRWHSIVIFSLRRLLDEQAPEDLLVDSEMTVRLDDHNRPEPDVLVATRPVAPDATWYPVDSVVLAVEVVSPESAHRDRTVKMHKYAEAGIRHFWRIENEDGFASTAVHVYELDDATRTYVPVTIARSDLELDRPFPIRIDVRALYPEQ
ncbi:Uma2 family endonuclease [Isoptericola jiangsuensis]|uniref:Uma2 family endonuclease n=1 Tax=Isoptericola jiangsuensis TaxID=548579 RepID=A0A2A9EZ94_9MICO|nr:Uma2 family endonuclease [Isoptericola jiangsuensis]PFG43861.1 Uma2 family endonuclease [Isoptericola jiangsuensis]